MVNFFEIITRKENLVKRQIKFLLGETPARSTCLPHLSAYGLVLRVHTHTKINAVFYKNSSSFNQNFALVLWMSLD